MNRTIRHRLRGWLPLVVLPTGFALLVLLPRLAEAHATFERSDPQPNSVLAQSPTEIRIWFAEPLEEDESRIRLYDQAGNLVPNLTSEKGEGDKSLVLPIPQPLDSGTYSVVWKNISAADGHPLQGYFTFTIGTAADIAAVIPPPALGDTGGAPLWLQTLARWLVLLSLAVAIAVWPIWLIVLRPALGRPDRFPVVPSEAEGPLVPPQPGPVPGTPATPDRSPDRSGGTSSPQRVSQSAPAPGEQTLTLELATRARHLGTWAVIVALLANLLMLGVQASFIESGSLPSRMSETLTDTRFGRLWLGRIGLLLLMGLVLQILPWLAPWRTWKHRIATAAGLLIAALLPLPVSLNAHAAALDTGRTTAIAFDYTHLLSASLWFGGLVVLVGVLLRTLRAQVDRRVVLAQALPRFSAMALVCWGLLAMTGLYAWWLQVGSWDALRHTSYGQSLLLKLILVGIVFLIAALNLLFITRKLAATDPAANPRWFSRLGYAVIAELVLATLILLAVGRMTSQQPGRDVIAAGRTGQTIHFDLNGRDAVLQLTPGAVGPNHYRVTVAGDPTPDGTETLLRLTYGGANIGVKEVTLDRSSGTTFETHGSEFGIAGDWKIQLIVRDIGSFEWTDTQPITIGIAGASAPKGPWRFGTGGVIGLLLLAIALISFVLAWRAGKDRMRAESAGLGAIAAVLGLILLAQGRIHPATGYDPGLVNPVAATSDAVTKGGALFQANCISCHGVAGKGDGPLADGMFPKPADFTAAHTTVHPDGQLFAWIQNGKTGTSMPAFGQTLSDEQIWQLIDYIQVTFQGKPLAPTGTPSPMAE